MNRRNFLRLTAASAVALPFADTAAGVQTVKRAARIWTLSDAYRIREILASLIRAPELTFYMWYSAASNTVSAGMLSSALPGAQAPVFLPEVGNWDDTTFAMYGRNQRRECASLGDDVFSQTHLLVIGTIDGRDVVMTINDYDNHLENSIHAGDCDVLRLYGNAAGLYLLNNPPFIPVET